MQDFLSNARLFSIYLEGRGTEKEMFTPQLSHNTWDGPGPKPATRLHCPPLLWLAEALELSAAATQGLLAGSRIGGTIEIQPMHFYVGCSHFKLHGSILAIVPNVLPNKHLNSQCWVYEKRKKSIGKKKGGGLKTGVK